MRRHGNPWPRIIADSLMLTAEAGAVVALRTAKLARGGREGEAEAERMVAEKIDALAAWQRLAWTGALGFAAPEVAAKTLTHYRRKVRANRRRLSGGA